MSIKSGRHFTYAVSRLLVSLFSKHPVSPPNSKVAFAVSVQRQQYGNTQHIYPVQNRNLCGEYLLGYFKIVKDGQPVICSYVSNTPIATFVFLYTSFLTGLTLHALISVKV
jgi:hypothetical protein